MSWDTCGKVLLLWTQLESILDNLYLPRSFKIGAELFFPLSPRSIHLAYVEDVDVKGIQAYRFAPPSDVLMSPENNPTNEGFCVPAGDCLGTGVLKVSVCREGRSTTPFPPSVKSEFDPVYHHHLLPF